MDHFIDLSAQLILDELRDAIHVLDQSGRFVYVNKKYEQICGLSREELMGKLEQELVDRNILSSSTALIALRERISYAGTQVYNTDHVVYSESTPIFSKDQNISCVITQSIDSKDFSRLQKLKKGEREPVYSKSYPLSTIQKELNLDGRDHVAVDKKTISIYMMAKRVSSVDTPVLLHGPQGVGKENVARYIHKNSGRADKSFSHIYSNTLMEETADRELFGYEDVQGVHQPGTLDLADGGTVYIDEVIGLPMRLQNKLLRLIHSGIATSATGESKRLNIRFIFGSLKSEQGLLEDPSVKREWYYVLSIFSIYISPLKERRDDIIPLLNNFLEEFNKQYHTHKKLERSAYERLLMYDWPGNHRELKILINRAVIISKSDYIGIQDLFLDSTLKFSAENLDGTFVQVNLKEETEKLEAEYMTRAFDLYKNTRAAAKSLGMDSSTFVRKRQAYIKKGLM